VEGLIRNEQALQVPLSGDFDFFREPVTVDIAISDSTLAKYV
jgi:hypothetical protein